MLENLNPSKRYKVEFMKDTEPAANLGGSRAKNFVTFFGFVATNGAAVTKVGRPSRRIQFIGDSITWGYGTLVGVLPETEVSCDSTADQHHAGSNYYAYSNMLCRTYGADCNYLAWGGIGLYYNADATVYPKTIPHVWRRTLATDTLDMWDHSSWIPGLVFINIGQNDQKWVCLCAGVVLSAVSTQAPATPPVSGESSSRSSSTPWCSL